MTTLFEVAFRSPMNDAQLAHLRAELGMTTNAHSHHPAVQPPLGHARLDFDSGVYLERREGEDRWALVCRTAGSPAPAAVDGWHLHAALAARRLDPSVAAPPAAEQPPLVARAAARPPSKIPAGRP